MIFKGIITRLRFRFGKKECAFFDGKDEYELITSEHVEQGAAVVVEGEKQGSRIAATSVIVLTEKDSQEVLQNIENSLKDKLPEGPSIVKDEMTEKLWPDIRRAALKILLAKRTGRKVLLHFHGDADGICGAFAITGLVYAKALQQNSAIYSVRDALLDIEAMGQENPLVILLDFGSNDASADGLKLLKAAGIEFLVIDHHPTGEKAPENLLSPFTVGGDVSRYTAGVLACEIAAACGMNGMKELAAIACSGDKSQVVENGPGEARKAMVLDFLAAHISFGNNLGFYKKVMAQEELFQSIASQADESIAEAADKAMKGMRKTEKEGVEIFSFSLENVVVKGEWPPASKITTRIFETLKGEKPLVCIGQTDRSVIIRLNDSAATLGLSANSLAKKMVESMSDFVVGGGGHVRAGAIRVKTGFTKDVVNQLIENIGSIK